MARTTERRQSVLLTATSASRAHADRRTPAAFGWLVRLIAVSSATLLFADAWFDVCTAPAGRPLWWAIGGMGVEIAEAAACLALAFAVWHDAADRP